MENTLKNEIDAIVRGCRITKDAIGLDLDTRENYPGEFYLLQLMHIPTQDLRDYYDAMP